MLLTSSVQRVAIHPSLGVRDFGLRDERRRLLAEKEV